MCSLLSRPKLTRTPTTASRVDPGRATEDLNHLQPGLYAGVIVLQVVTAVALILLARKMLSAIHSQGQTVFSAKFRAKLKKWFGGSG
jgi:hypothetical protein